MAQIALQRCTNHKLWNSLAKAPAHLGEELAEDYGFYALLCVEPDGRFVVKRRTDRQRLIPKLKELRTEAWRRRKHIPIVL
jgi:hypothetical protein